MRRKRIRDQWQEYNKKGASKRIVTNRKNEIKRQSETKQMKIKWKSFSFGVRYV